jgi:hypothetical protein
MESTWTERHRQTGLTIVADMIDHRGEARSEFRQRLDDLGEPTVDRIKAGPHGGIVEREGHGPGSERATVTSALRGMPLDFAHGDRGYMRTFRELALTPAKLADTVTYSSNDRSPVLWIAFRHAFLRAPLPAPRLAEHCAIPSRTGTNRNQAKAFRNKCGAEISPVSIISSLWHEDCRDFSTINPQSRMTQGAAEGTKGPFGKSSEIRCQREGNR